MPRDHAPKPRPPARHRERRRRAGASLLPIAGLTLLLALLLGSGGLPGVTGALGATPAATPSLASPAATPMPGTGASPVASLATPRATGCGGSTATEVAEAFVAAAAADDLTRARSCFDPAATPASWDEMFLGPGHANVLGCQGRPYTVYVSHLDPGLDAIIFGFRTPCVIANLDDWQQSLYDSETLPVPVVVVQVEQTAGRWYVLNAFASVPD